MNEGVPQAKENNENNESYGKWLAILKEEEEAIRKGGELGINLIFNLTLKPEGAYNKASGEEEKYQTYSDEEMYYFDRQVINYLHPFGADESRKLQNLLTYARYVANTKKPPEKFVKGIDIVKELMTALDSKEIQKQIEEG